MVHMPVVFAAVLTVLQSLISPLDARTSDVGNWTLANVLALKPSGEVVTSYIKVSSFALGMYWDPAELAVWPNVVYDVRNSSCHNRLPFVCLAVCAFLPCPRHLASVATCSAVPVSDH